MTDVETFRFAGVEVRAWHDEARDVWFPAADLAQVLQIKNIRKQLGQLDEDERLSAQLETAGGLQRMTLVSESGLYALILRSRTDQARTFRRFVTQEVLPSIRARGSYTANQPKALPDSRALAMMVIAAEDRADELVDELARTEERLNAALAMLDPTTDLSVADAAKLLCRAGHETGRDRLFAHLADRRWIYKQGGRWQAYQHAVQHGFIAVLPQSHNHPHTGARVVDPPQIRVTPKGLERLLRDALATTGAAQVEQPALQIAAGA